MQDYLNEHLDEKDQQEQDLQKQIDRLLAKIKACNMMAGIGLVLFIILFIFMYTSFETELILQDFSYVGNYVFYATMAASVIMIIGFFRGGKYRGLLKSLISNQVAYHLLKEYVDLIRYNKYRKVPTDIINKLKIIEGWRSADGSDYIDAKHKGQAFKFSDLHLFWVERVSSGSESGSQDRIHTVFKGQWLICNLPNPCPTWLVIKENVPNIKPEMGNFGTDNPDFNNRFVLQTDDVDAALSMLTPELIQKVEKLANSFKGRLFLAFDKQTLNIGMQTGHDFFEVTANELRQNGLEAIRDKIRGEIGYICTVIDIIFDK